MTAVQRNKCAPPSQLALSPSFHNNNTNANANQSQANFFSTFSGSSRGLAGLEGSRGSGSGGSSEVSAERREQMARYELHMGQMQHVFNCFASFGGCLNSTSEMDGTHFTRMLKEAKLIDRQQFTTVDADLLFRKMKAKNARFITVQTFLLQGLPEIASRKKLQKEVVRTMLYEAATAFVPVDAVPVAGNYASSVLGSSSQRFGSPSSPLQNGEASVMMDSSANEGGGGGRYKMARPSRGASSPRGGSASPRPPTAGSSYLRGASPRGNYPPITGTLGRARDGTPLYSSAGPNANVNGAPVRFKHVRSISAQSGHRVRLYDDKRQYTGVYKAGGPTSADRDPASLAKVVDRRAQHDIRGTVW